MARLNRRPYSPSAGFGLTGCVGRGFVWEGLGWGGEAANTKPLHSETSKTLVKAEGQLPLKGIFDGDKLKGIVDSGKLSALFNSCMQCVIPSDEHALFNTSIIVETRASSACQANGWGISAAGCCGICWGVVGRGGVEQR